MKLWPPPPEGESHFPLSPKPSAVREFLNWFFAVPSGKRTMWTIIAWWEVRRIVYNLIVGSVGIVSLLLFFYFITHSTTLGPGEDAIEPMGVVAVPVLLNIGYSGGVFLEILLSWRNPEQTREVGPNLLRAGFYFSLGVVLLPSVLWGLIWIVHVL